MTRELGKYNESIFERIKHLNEIEQKYWSAREFYRALDYKKMGQIPQSN
jgi:hypothetical protein